MNFKKTFAVITAATTLIALYSATAIPQNFGVLKEVNASSIQSISGSSTPIVVNLNNTATYKNHTQEEIMKRWLSSRIDNSIPVFKIKPICQNGTFRAGVYTDQMKNALLRFSNYEHFLAGLTEFQKYSNYNYAGYGAVLEDRIGYLNHTPSKPNDMSSAFYKSAFTGTSSSNLYQGIDGYYAENYMSAIRGWIDDTNNISNFELGHRYTFFQRAGYKISYGACGDFMAQMVEPYNEQYNTTGTVQGINNNDYAYAWPSAGAFPTNEIDTSALWSININTNKVKFSKNSLKIVITDLNTGKKYDQSKTIGTSQWSGDDYYYYGCCIDFKQPNAYSYDGKKYKVTISNLRNANGSPMILQYTINFFSYNGSHMIDGSRITCYQDGAVKQVKVGKIVLNKNNLTLGVGETYTLQAQNAPTYLINKNISWHSTNSNIVSVSKGKIVAKRSGTATIYATSSNGKKASCKITVKAPVKTLNLNYSSISMGEGENLQLFSWVNNGSASAKRAFASSNNNIINTTGNGLLTAKSKGTATITVKTYNGKTAVCKVTVKQPVQSLYLNKYELTLNVGQSFKLVSWVNSGSASAKRAFASSNNNIVHTAGNGILTAKSKGTATIIVKTYNNKTAICKVIVK